MSSIAPSESSHDEATASVFESYDRGRCSSCLAIACRTTADDTGARDSLLSNPDLSFDREASLKRCKPSMKNTLTWRPEWLRPVVLSTFIALFLISTASLATMLYLSERHHGLVRTRPDLEYLWRFGPTAALTIMSIFWSRVETQVLRYMPWISYGHQQSPHINPGDFDLDYTAMLSPAILIQSSRRKHYLVFIIVVISVVLKIQIVLASSLYSLEFIRVSESVDIEILDVFNTTAKAVRTEDTSPYYIAHGTKNFEMRPPFGIAQNIAYQTFQTVDGSRGTVDAPLEVVVDGYFSEARCLKLESYSHLEIPEDSNEPNSYSIGLKLWFQSCEQPILVDELDHERVTAVWDPDREENRTHWVGHTALSESRACAQLSQEEDQTDIQSLYFAARFGKSSGNSSTSVLLDVAGVLCSARSWISKVQVVDNGTDPLIKPLQDAIKTPVAANLWDLIDFSVPLSFGGWNRSMMNRAHGPISTAIEFYGIPEDTPANGAAISIYTNETFYLSAMNMSRVLSPWVGHYRLREVVKQPIRTTASKLPQVHKLIVSKWICVSMMTLFGLLALTLVVTLLSYRSMTAIWYRDPATILGNLLFIRDNAEYVKEALISESRFEDGTSTWSHCSFTPIVLRRWARATFAVIGLAIIAGLSYSLIQSRDLEGLATIDKERGYLHLTWTSVPTIVMLCIALYISCCDSAYRGLGILSKLSAESCSTKELDMSFTNMLGLRVLYDSLQTRIRGLTLSQLLAIICAFLTTLASAIFTLQVLPKDEVIVLQQSTWFGSSEKQNSSISKSRRKALGALVLRQGEGALKYPQNTYDDLVFPVLDNADNLNFSQNISVKASIPAAKLNSTCWELSPDIYRAKFSGFGNRDIDLVANESFSCPNGSQATFSVSMTPPQIDLTTIGSTKPKACGLSFGSLDDFYHSPNRFQTYAWGKFSKKNREFQHLSIWRCNYSWTEVPTEVHLRFSGGEYVLDSEKRPQPDLSRARPWSPPFDVPHIDGQFGNIESAIPDVNTDATLIGELSEWFRPLMRPFGRFSLDAFEDPSQEEQILDDLHHQYGFLAAQLANLENRFDITESSETDPPPSLPHLEAVATDNGRRRLVQDPRVTYVIIAILSLTIIANLWALGFVATGLTTGKSRLLHMKVEGLAPDGCNSMAAMAALLSNSNILSRLPGNANSMSAKELNNHMSGLRFQMGWFLDEATQTKHYTIGAMDDEDFKFIGSKEQMDKESRSSISSS
ncbi:hypothetical protein CGCF415_v014710 [Colletotrichum fructicola]|nr:hypothetical protein CGCF415_v014710 [Colletotrichum fructicola]KAF4924156.1 hypothetical protein CGCF245_v014642 [Colletotrichum fructicola]